MWMRHSPHRRLLIAIAGLCLVLGIVAYAAIPRPAAGDIAVVDAKFVEEDGMRFLSGTVVNGSRAAFSDVALEAHFFDTEGTMLGSARTTTTLLAGNEEWQFDIPVRYEGAVVFETSIVAVQDE